MSMFEDKRYRWRETYFVLFPLGRCPTLKAVEEALAALGRQYALSNGRADDSGRFESLSLLSPDDFSALDICFTGGAEVLEQGAALAKEVEPAACEVGEAAAWKRILQCDGRFDVLHFEQVLDRRVFDEDEPDEILDPTALLLVLDALTSLTDGIAVDPQTGTVFSNEE